MLAVAMLDHEALVVDPVAADPKTVASWLISQRQPVHGISLKLWTNDWDHPLRLTQLIHDMHAWRMCQYSLSHGIILMLQRNKSHMTWMHQ